MYANPSEFEFQGTIFRFREPKKYRRCLFTFSIKHETRHFASYSSCKTVKKCTKKRDASAKLLFCSLCLLFFYLLDGVASLNLEVSNLFVKGQNKVLFRACLHGGEGPQVGEVKYGGSPHQSCKRDQIKIERLYGQTGYPT